MTPDSTNANRAECVEILFTIDDQRKAEELTARLVELRLIACGQISAPVTSIYRWQGNVEHATEWKVTLKTKRANQPAVVQFLQENHPYDVPEIIAHPLEILNPAYQRWLEEETR